MFGGEVGEGDMERGERRIDEDLVCSEEMWMDSEVGSWMILSYVCEQ